MEQSEMQRRYLTAAYVRFAKPLAYKQTGCFRPTWSFDSE
jgi:hypothetical protein